MARLLWLLGGCVLISSSAFAASASKECDSAAKKFSECMSRKCPKAPSVQAGAPTADGEEFTDWANVASGECPACAPEQVKIAKSCVARGQTGPSTEQQPPQAEGASGSSSRASRAGGSHAACKATTFQTQGYREACERGGQKEAKDYAKAYMKQGRQNGTQVSCTTCHTQVGGAYGRKPEALQKYFDMGQR